MKKTRNREDNGGKSFWYNFTFGRKMPIREKENPNEDDDEVFNNPRE